MEASDSDARRSCLFGDTLDDLMRAAVEDVQRNGSRISVSRGEAWELSGVLLELTDPRARLSRTETRGRLFSALGELCWYLAKTNSAQFISYYIPQYQTEAEGGIVHGAYGPRLFNQHGQDQVRNVIDLLRRKPSTRRAVIQVFDAADLAEEHKDVPCTCSLQFLARDQRLHLFTSMRSNDVFLGLPHDVFCFTMIQELVARTLGLEVGVYKHAVGSLHLYEQHRDDASAFVNEGWQATDSPMPAMPFGDPWPSVEVVLRAEAAIRESSSTADVLQQGLEPYWADLVRLLEVFSCMRKSNVARISELREQMASPVYDVFIEAKIQLLTRRGSQ